MTSYDALWSVEDHVEGVLRAEGPLTQSQLVERLYALPVSPTGNIQVDRERRTALRGIQAAIQTLRRRGVPVIDSPQGMRIARTSAECMDEYRRLRSRFLTQAVTARGVLRAARRLAEAEASVEPLTLWDAA